MPEPIDNLDWSPGEALRRAAERADATDTSACFTILLNANDGHYQTGFFCAGLKTSEAVALLEVVKSKLLMQLNGVIPPPDIQ